MKIILLQDVGGVGKKGDIKEIADGYARNFLIPNKKAEFATENAIKRVQTLKSILETETQVQDVLISKIIESLKESKIIIKSKTNEAGHLFASLHPEDISLALKNDLNLDIEPKCVILEKPIKEVGQYDIEIKLGKFSGSVKVDVVN